MGKTILVIDDDEMLRDLIVRFLAHSNMSAITAANGQSGVDKYESEHPDLVVLDVAMPGMSGFEVAKAIRGIEQRDSRPHTPIIILTAYTRSFFSSSGGETTVDSYLTKPIEPDQLLTHIRRFLGE